MPKLLQINVVANWGSTGKIAEQIGLQVMEKGWESYITWRRYMNPSKSNLICVGTKFELYLHGGISLLDRHGLGSVRATSALVRKVKAIEPDIIHLHVVHDYFINYPILFKFLKSYGKPVVWTFHDCWAFTGHCAYFEAEGCLKWQTRCEHCENLKKYPKAFLDHSKKNFNLKKELFTQVPNMTIVPVSDWLGNLVQQSFLKDYPMKVIHNGINTEVFRPLQNDAIREKYGIDKDKHILLGLSSLWEPRKGLKDFFKLNNLIDREQYQIVLVGLNVKQISDLPEGIIGIARTDNVNELVALYSEATLFLNPTYEDNFPTINIESLACGTPVVTYKTGGSIEAVDDKTGFIIEQGDIEGLYDCAKTVVAKGKNSYTDACRHRALENFDAGKCYMQYIDLYEELMNGM